MTYSRKFAAALAASVCIVAIAAPASAQTRTYNVPAGSLKSALDAYARQSGRQVIYKSDEVRPARSPGAKGAMSADAALHALLAGTGFSVRGDTSGAIAIVRSASTPSGESQAGNAAADDASVDEDERGKAEILVVGSRSQNVDIRRTEDDPQPYVVFDRNVIERSNASSVEDFLRTRLPMNATYASNEQNVGFPTENGPVSKIDLRGLGADQTLILVDGRRAPRMNLRGGDFAQADINGLPLDAIERIEILPSTAGGIYGGGAVGGVINIVKKRDYTGFDVRLGYEGTFRGGGETQRASITGGFTPNRGSTQITFTVSRERNQPLYVGDNELGKRGRDLFLNSYGFSSKAYGSVYGYLPNIRTFAASFVPLPLKPEYGVGSLGVFINNAYVPAGFAGVNPADPTSVAPLVATGGHYSPGLSNDALGARAVLKSAPSRWSANVNVRQRITNFLDAYIDGQISYNNGKSFAQFGLPERTVDLPATAPNNPFQNPIRVNIPLIGVEFPQTFESRSRDFTGGLIAQLGGKWSATGEFNIGDARSTYRYLNGAAGLFKPELMTALTNGTIDVLKDPNKYPINWSAYYVDPLPYAVGGPYVTTRQSGSLRASGPLFRLPGGSLTVSALLEARSETAKQSLSKVPITTSITQTTVIPERTQSAESGYFEFTAPVISPSNDVPLVRALEIQGAIRYDRYRTTAVTPGTFSFTGASATPPTFVSTSTRVHSTDFVVAAKWSPISDVAFRSSYSTGFLPPSIQHLTPQAADAGGTFFGYRDPQRGNELVGTSAPFQIEGGGNPNLEPEISRSFSIGTIVTPRSLPGLRVSVDYTRIKKTNEIVSLASLASGQIPDETVFPQYVVRGPKLATDPATWAGAITYLFVGDVNVARTHLSAFDGRLDYDLETRGSGKFHVYAAGTHQVSLRRQLFPSSAPFDLVDRLGGPLRWRGNFGLDWQAGGLSLGWNTQYYSSYSVRTGRDPTSSTNNTAVIDQGSERIPAQTYSDIYVSYNFGRGSSVLDGVVLSAGIQNVFDKLPPVVASPSVLGGYSYYGDPRLRRFTLNVSKHF